MEKEEVLNNEEVINQEAYLIEKWESITIANDFAFCKIMQDEELLAELLRRVLPDVEFSRLDIQSQKEVDVGADIHGVRFDVFATDKMGKAATVEMQVIQRAALPQRIRFYSSMADTQMLEKGIPYSELRDSYIIMICPFDMFGRGLHKYTFRKRCEELADIQLSDGETAIVLNAVGTVDDVDEKLKAFLDYVAGKTSEDEYVKKLMVAVDKARMNKEWRREYMTLYQRDLENQAIGREKGLAEGLAEGLAKGRAEGREEGVCVMVDLCKSLGVSSVDAVEKIAAKMGIPQREAEELVQKYW